MGKHKRKQNGDPQELLALVRQKLAAGRSMSALKEAKELHKRAPSAETEDLLAEAYAARIHDLSGSGMHAEAAELVGIARERFPARADLWDGASTVAARQRGDLSDLLRRWQDEADARDEVAAELRRSLRNPAWIADCDALAPDDPLRSAAMGVQAAFQQAARGQLDDAGRDALRQVGRRSPLVPWRAFVLALDAFHRHDDARCREHLGAIADDDATARGRDVLRAAMLDREVPGDPDLARAVRRLVGTVPDAVAAASAPMERELDSDAWFDAVQAVLRTLKTIGRVPLQRFLFWMTGLTDGESAFGCAEAVGAGDRWLGRDGRRIAGLLAPGPLEAVAAWTAWLLEKPSLVQSLGDQELAIALEYLEDVLPDFVARLGHGPPADLLGVWAADGEVGAALDALAAVLREDPDDALELMGVIGLVKVFELVGQRTGVTHSGRGAVVKVLRHVVALHPSHARFERLLARLGKPSEREAALAAWADALPGDPKPWLLRSADAEARRSFDLALRHLDRAEQLAPFDARVRTARFRVTLGKLRKHWRAGRQELCVRDVAELEALPAARAPEVRWFLGGVRQLLDPATVDETIWAEVGDEPRRRALESVVRHALEERAPRAYGSTPAERLRAAAFAARIAAAVGLPLSQPPERIGPVSSLAAGDLPADPEDLLAICEFSMNYDQRRLRALAASAGLRVDGPRLARFLAHHADGLPMNATRRSARCVRLARYFAARTGDAVALEMLPRSRFDLEAPMDDAEAMAALAAERAHATDEKAARKRPKKKDPQRTLPFDAGTPGGEA